MADSELDGFVDALARRIAAFDHRAMRRRIPSTRSHYHPPTGSSTPSIPFRSAPLTRPETPERIPALLEPGLPRDRAFEKQRPAGLCTLLHDGSARFTVAAY